MNLTFSLALAALLSFIACAQPGEAGDPCTTDDDCADGLECHVHDHEEGEHDEEEGEHDEEEGEEGVCEEHSDDEE